MSPTEVTAEERSLSYLYSFMILATIRSVCGEESKMHVQKLMLKLYSKLKVDYEA